MYNHHHYHAGNNNNNNNNWNNNNTGNHNHNGNNHNHNSNQHRPSSSSTAATSLTTSTTSSSTMTSTFTLEQQQQKQIEALRRQLAIKDETILDLNASIITIEAETQAKLQENARGNDHQQMIQQQNELLQQQLQEQKKKETANQIEMNRLQQQLRHIRQEANISNSRLIQLKKKLLLQQQQTAIIHASNNNNSATNSNAISSSSLLLSQQISPSPTIRTAPPQQQHQHVVQSPSKQLSTPSSSKETAHHTGSMPVVVQVASTLALTSNLHSSFSIHSGNNSGGNGNFCGLAQHLLQTVAPATTKMTMMMMTSNGFTSTSIASSFQSQQQPDESTLTTTMTMTAFAQQDRILVYLGKVIAAAAAAVSAAPSELSRGNNNNNNIASERSMLVFLLQECSSSLPILLPTTTTTTTTTTIASTSIMGQGNEKAAAAASSAENISSNSKNDDNMEIDMPENQLPATTAPAKTAPATTAPAAASAITGSMPVVSNATSTTSARPTNPVTILASTVSRDYISYTWLYHFILVASYNKNNDGACSSRIVLHWLLDHLSSQQQQQHQLIPPIKPVLPMEVEGGDDYTPHTSNVTHKEHEHHHMPIRKRKMAIRLPLVTAVSDTAARDTSNTAANNGEQAVASDHAQHLDQQERLKERLALRAQRLVGQCDRMKEDNHQLTISSFYPDSEKSVIAAFMQSCRSYALLLPLLLVDNNETNNINCRRSVQNKNQNSHSSTSLHTATTMVAETSIRALQIVALLHSQQHDFHNEGVWIRPLFLLPKTSTGGCSSRPVAVTAESGGEGQEVQNECQEQSDNEATCLLDLWCHASCIILDRGCVDKNDSDDKKITKRRFLGRQEQQHEQRVGPASSTGGHSSAAKNKQSGNGDAPNFTTGAANKQLQMYSTLTSSLAKRMSILSNEMLYNWMAASLHVLRIFWRTTVKSSTTSRILVPNTSTTDYLDLCSSQARRQQEQRQQHHEFWLDSAHPRARNLLAAVLDWMQVILLPTPALHDHPLAMEAIAWLQCLIDQPPMIPQSRDSYELISTTTTTSSRDLQQHHQPCFLLLLRTQMSTTASAPRVWHRADTAIGVAVKFFHILVLRQHQDDHLANKASKEQNDQLNPIRDALVRFFDSLLRVTQHERRRQEAVSLNKNVNVGGSKKKAKSSASLVSFWTLLSEYQELYTSAASLLLTTTTANASTAAENCTTGCHVDADILAMLRMQMHELVCDEEEREEGFQV